MNKTFRLEFNEKQQMFHHNYGQDLPETNGWVTIIEHISDEESVIFDCYINRTGKKKFTTEYLFKSRNELIKFTYLLMEYNINIKS
jgi:hypothetical protein